MTALETTTTTITTFADRLCFDEAQLAAVAFLARYSGRTLDAYRHDLRIVLPMGAVTTTSPSSTRPRPHIELYRSDMEDRGLAASTIDRRLSTVCGFYRFAHIDGRFAANPAQYVRRPKVHPPKDAAWTAPNSAPSCSPPNVPTAPTPPWPCCSGSTACGSSEACGTNIEDLGFNEATAPCASSAKATSPP